MDSDLERRDLKDDLSWRVDKGEDISLESKGVVGNIGKPSISVPKALLIALKVNSWATELEVQL